jgi:pimeloyl-ACP methyl ester carboxylesterase
MDFEALMTDEDTTGIVAEEHWAKRGDIELCLWRKFAPAAQAAKPGRPVLVLVHGSSFSARTTYDLSVPGHGEYSTMNVFAKLGYDVWTMDHEGYGRSSHTDGFSFVKDGVADLEAAAPMIAAATGRSSFCYFGSSSGALRAGGFANAAPDRVEKLGMAALVWTGEGSPTLTERVKRIDEWRAANRRIVDQAAYERIFSRDVVGLTIPELPKAVAAAEMANGGGSVPNGTYIDMCVNLPLVDPTKIACSVLIYRGDHDGVATDADVMAFFAALPCKDKQFVMASGQAHNTTLGVNRHRFWTILDDFLRLPPRLDDGRTGKGRA